MSEETELKLLIPPKATRRLVGHRLLKGRSGAVVRRLRSIYFDTPELDLWRRGIALRLRRDGRRWLQTIKGRGSVHGGLHRREEIECAVPGPSPRLVRLGNSDLARALALPRLRDRLQPVFVTDFERSRRLLELEGGTRIEASIDRGAIYAGARREPLNELELELKHGEPRRLYELALKLAEEMPLSVCDRSKAQRGYALASGAPGAPVRSRPTALRAGMSVNEAFHSVMWAGLAHLQANEPGFLEGHDPEYLHQMRVALRRLRSALALFAPQLPASVAPLRSELKWLAASLGPARDWDVFATETLPPIEAEFGADGALRDLVRRCASLRRGARARARRAIGSARFRHFVLSLAAWLAAEGRLTGSGAQARAAVEEPVSRFAGVVLEQRYTRTRERGRKLASLSPDGLHRLRIAIKKFRYATDFFAGLYERAPARQLLARLERLQDILGAMNDAATVADLIGRGFSSARGRGMAEAKGIVLGWSRGRAVMLKRELKDAWKEFRAARRFW